MKNLKLIQVLRSFTPKELDEFTKFVNSPYFNESKILSRLLEALKPFHPEFAGKDFDKRHLFSQFRPGEEFSDKLLRNAFSGLYKLSQQFISHIEYKTDTASRTRFLLRSLSKRQIDKLFEKYISIEDVKGYDAAVSLNKFLHEKIELKDLLIYHVPRKESFQDIVPELIKQGDFTVLLFLFYLMRLFIEMEYSKHHYNFDPKTSEMMNLMKYFDLDSYVKSIEDKKEFGYRYIITFYYFYKSIIDTSDNNNMFEAMKLFTEIKDRLSSKDLETFSVISYNALLYRTLTGRGNPTFVEMKLRLLAEMISRGQLGNSPERFIPPVLFRNTIFSYVYLDQLDSAEEFINNNIDKIDPEEREHLFNTLYAHIEMKRKNYEKAHEHLIKINYSFEHKYPGTKFEVKAYLIMIYYETNSLDELISLIDSSRHYLSKEKKIESISMEKYKNFLVYVNKLVNFKLSSLVSDLSRFKHEIETDEVENKPWLIEKVIELEKIQGKTGTLAVQKTSV